MKRINDKILLSLLENGQMTCAELVDAHPSVDKNKVRNTIYQLKHQALTDRIRDDVTGSPAYKLTASGRERAEKAKAAGPAMARTPAEDPAEPGAADDVPCFIQARPDVVAVEASEPMLSIEHDPVERPKHYTSHPSGVECIQVTEHMGFNLGNAVKYIWRADLKVDAIEDLRKARWYIDRELQKRGAA